MNSAATAISGEAAILNRLIQPERADLTPDAARAIMKLAFGDDDCVRLHDLAEKAQSGTLTKAEQDELGSYRRVGRLLEIMHSKARRSLKAANAEP